MNTFSFVFKVNGGWSGWSTTITWRGSCSTTCGAGTESGFKTRTCTNPTPQNGGNACSGSSTQEQYRSCKVKECPGKLLQTTNIANISYVTFLCLAFNILLPSFEIEYLANVVQKTQFFSSETNTF